MEVSPDRAALEEFFAGVPLGLEVYDVVAALVDARGPATTRVTRSQVAFRRRTGFCWIWLPGRYLRRPTAEVVLSVALDHRDPSPRWKEVVAVGAGRWMHHLEVDAVTAVDGEVAGWVAAAYDLAR